MGFPDEAGLPQVEEHEAGADADLEDPVVMTAWQHALGALTHIGQAALVEADGPPPVVRPGHGVVVERVGELGITPGLGQHPVDGFGVRGQRLRGCRDGGGQRRSREELWRGRLVH